MLLDEVDEWFLGLDGTTAELVTAAIDLLAAEGPTLGRPVVDRVKGSARHNMKELRPGSTGRTEVRILFVFDPERKAVLLVAGESRAAGRTGTEPTSRSPRHATRSGWPVTAQRRSDMARNWKDVRSDAVSGGLVDEERVTHATRALADAVQGQRLADIRKAQALNQQTLAKRMKVSQARISKIEHGTLTHTEVGTLESYVEALGGRLRVVAEFDDESIALH